MIYASNSIAVSKGLGGNVLADYFAKSIKIYQSPFYQEPVTN